MAGNLPKCEWKEGLLSISMWENPQDDGSIRKSYTLRKSWRKDDKSEWQESTMTLFKRDLRSLTNVINSIFLDDVSSRIPESKKE
jgi:hypothetical protein